MRTQEQILEAAKVAFENRNMLTQRLMSLAQFVKIEENKDLRDAAKFRILSENIIKETEKAILYKAKLDLASNNNTIVEAWIPKSAIQNNIVADWYFEKNSKLKNI
jgi:hypothetical protein